MNRLSALFKQTLKITLVFVFFLMFLLSCSRGNRTGAVCEDGWHSTATGSGACSWHGGVDHREYNNEE